MFPEEKKTEFVSVWVRDPRIQKEDFWHSYIDYEICIHTNSMCFTMKTSCVRRRFREFVWLRQRLQSNALLIQLPELPSKNLFFNINNRQHVDQRRRGLEEFLRKTVQILDSCPSGSFIWSCTWATLAAENSVIIEQCIRHRARTFPGLAERALVFGFRILQNALLLSDSRLHLFLQSHLSSEDIEACVSGQTSYSVTEAIHKFASSNRRFPEEDDEERKKENSRNYGSESSSSGLGHSCEDIHMHVKTNPALQES